MRHAVDRHAAFETDAHSAKWPARLAGDRLSECRFTRGKYRRRDGRAVFDRDLLIIYGERYQCSVNVLEGKYGSGEIAGVRPTISSASSSAVPSDVVMPSPS